jgi:putative ABC transport system ATP-binding protein
MVEHEAVPLWLSTFSRFATFSLMNTSEPLVIVNHVEKVYATGQRTVAALRGVSLEMLAGEFVALMGPSGCGKSTLLHLLGGMDRPTHGRVVIGGTELATLSETALAQFRRRRVGFIFQFFNLLPTLTVLENAALPLMLDGVSDHEAQERAMVLLERVGLHTRASHFPAELSGGEMQRVAVARAVISKPALILADEPTGSLDSENGRQVMALLRELNHELGLTIVLATHDDEAARFAGRIIRLRDGMIEQESRNVAIR